MSDIEKRSLIGYLREKHRKVGKREKGIIIDEVCERLQVSRKHAIKLLSPRMAGRPRKPGKRGRPGKYQDKEFKDALRLFWKLTKRLCGRRLHSAIPSWIKAVEEYKEPFRADIKQRLLSISPPTIDRILKPYKVNQGTCLTRNGGFRDQIPIQGNIWDIEMPGHMETDTVAHCGGSLHGEFVNTVTMVDIATMWSETRAVFGRGSNAVFDAIRDIEDNLPFAIKGYDADNGGEVLNEMLYRYFVTERALKGLPIVPVTRSRAYKKNDNAHVEQRNDVIARKYLGYERIDAQQIIPLINHYYANLVCPFINHFLPSFKLSEKRKIKSRTHRIYGYPKTPYERLMSSEHLTDIQKSTLERIHQRLNPVKLSKQIDIARELINGCLARLRAGASLPYNTPRYCLSNPLLPDLQNSGSNFQVFHHSKYLESFSHHTFRYDDL